MPELKVLICPICKKNNLVVKYEASHVYSYVVDDDAPGLKNTDEFLSFKYDDRKLVDSRQYVECQSCGSKFPCDFNIWNGKASLEELQRIINEHHH